MSRATRERWIAAQERWPQLQQLVASHFHQDALLLSDSFEGVIDQAVQSRTLEQRQQVAREWWNWNATAGATQDIRPQLNDGFGVDWNFAESAGARKFMNAIYDALIVSIRKEAGQDWKP